MDDKLFVSWKDDSSTNMLSKVLLEDQENVAAICNDIDKWAEDAIEEGKDRSDVAFKQLLLKQLTALNSSVELALHFAMILNDYHITSK